jgi:DNA-binding MarR family transcriptional regulator
VPRPAASHAAHHAATETEIRIFQAATRDLVGLALRSLSAAPEPITLRQFRLLAAIGIHGPCPTTRIAETLGQGAPATTRMASRLSDHGYITRHPAPGNRNVVELELTSLGRELVAAIEQRRRRELGGR